MARRPEEESQRRLLRVVQASVALSLGVMFACLLSIKEVNPVLRIEFSATTVAGFVVAAVLSWVAWQWMFLTLRRTRARGLVLVIFCALLAAATLAAFAFALKNVSAERLEDLETGAGCAVGFLGVLGYLFWRVARFLEKDSARSADPRDAE